MMPVSDMNAGAAQPMAAAGQTPEASKVRHPGEETRDRPPRPVTDEYIPEQPREPSGRYWVDRDESGQPRIYFDGRLQAADAPDVKGPDGDAPEEKEPGQTDEGTNAPEKKDDSKDERCIGNTDRVDREIEKLKKKRQELEQRLRTETDGNKIRELERQLARIDQELAQKDNDAYRRQHTRVTRST